MSLGNCRWACHTVSIRFAYRRRAKGARSLIVRLLTCKPLVAVTCAVRQLTLPLRHKDEAAHLDPNYCGECYGAPSPSDAQKPGCCNTCDDVRNAYASISWSFGRGEGVEQCEREHYAEHLDAQRKEGCRLEGSIKVNKVIGNFHIAPGKSFSNGNMHVHDLENYFKDETHTFTHKIHHLRFGPQLSDAVIADMQQKHANAGPGGWTNHHINPLDNTEQQTTEKAFNFMYFVKVVSTAYLPLGWEKLVPGRGLHENFLGATIDTNYKGSIETHQYSVTSHKRNLAGGSDESEGHKERIHARGGIPGVFFSYVSVALQDLSYAKSTNSLQ